MANRGFPIVTIAAVPVPAFGTTLASAVTVTPDTYTGNTNPASQRSVGSGTTSAVVFRRGDRVLIGTASQLASGGGDGASVSNVNTAGTLVTFQGLTRSHAAGEFVVLVMSCSAINLQWIGGSFYLGEDSTVGATSNTLIRIVTGDESNWGLSAVGNVFDTQHLWVSSTTGSQFLPSLITI